MPSLKWTVEMLDNLVDRKGAAFVVMAPRDFLALTIDRPLSEWRQLVSDEMHSLDQYNQWALKGDDHGHRIRVGPFLKIIQSTGKVIGHEGRHRALALDNAGGDKMLVGVILADDAGYAQRGRGPGDLPRILTSEFKEWPGTRSWVAAHSIDEVREAVAAATRKRNPGQNDEEVVSPEGELCTVKDCCVVICDEGAPQENPGRGKYTDREAITRAFDAVGTAVEKAYGLNNALRVTETLYALPIVYNARLTRAIGRAKFATVQGIAHATMIELTGTVDIPDDYMHRLLVHEGCHVACCILAGGGFAYEPPHGSRWQELMVKAGERPEAKCIDPRILAQTHARRGIEVPAVQLAPHELRIGDRVSFSGKGGGKMVATVISKSPKTATVRDDSNGRWRVSYSLLTKETAP